MNDILTELSQTDLARYFPNVILPALFDTLQMVVISGALSILFGLIFGILLYMAKPNGLNPNKYVYRILGFLTDIVRAFPTMILIVSLAPITRRVIGTTIGTEAAIFAITIGCIPFATRMTENSLNTVNRDVIRAAIAFGATKTQTISKVVLPEALANLVSNFTLMLINLLSMSTIAGAVGAGGLGAVALTYGYQRFNYLIMYFIVVILIIIVFIIQQTGKELYKKLL